MNENTRIDGSIRHAGKTPGCGFELIHQEDVCLAFRKAVTEEVDISAVVYQGTTYGRGLAEGTEAGLIAGRSVASMSVTAIRGCPLLDTTG